MIPASITQLVEPLERFEAIRRKVVRLGDRLCDLSYANPYDGAEARTRAVLRDAVDRERVLDLQYSPFGGKTPVRRSVADALTQSHDLPFEFRDVILTPGAMAALHLSLRVAADAGDEVTIPVPCWLDYPLYARYLGLDPVLVPLASPDLTLDVPRITNAVTPRTTALLLSHPSNPAGRCYREAELETLCAGLRDAEARIGRPITLIADETHRDFVAPGRYRSLAHVWPRTILVYSFGKYHFIQGQRIGYAAVSPRHPERDAVSRDLVTWSRVMGFCTPTALMQTALPGLMALSHDHGAVDEWRARYTDELTAAGYAVPAVDSTLFLYPGTPDDEDDYAFTERMARQGVLILPAPVFHHRGHFRITLSASGPMLQRALDTLTKGGAG